LFGLFHGRVMWHLRDRREIQAEFWWGNVKRLLGRPRLRWEDDSTMELTKQDWKGRTGLLWLKIWTSGGLLWTMWWTFAFHKMFLYWLRKTRTIRAMESVGHTSTRVRPRNNQSFFPLIPVLFSYHIDCSLDLPITFTYTSHSVQKNPYNPTQYLQFYSVFLYYSPHSAGKIVCSGFASFSIVSQVVARLTVQMAHLTNGTGTSVLCRKWRWQDVRPILYLRLIS